MKPLVAMNRTGLTALAVLLVALPPTIGCRRENAPPTNSSGAALPSLTVGTVRIELKEHPASEDVPGTIRAKRRTSVEAKVSGRIRELTVQAGDTVAAGAVLARLDVQEIKARLDQTTAQLEQAGADLKRMTGLFRQQIITQQELDAVIARERIASAAVTESRTLLDYAVITAPFAGVITRKLVENGDLAAPGKSLLEIEDPTSLRFEADVPETLLTQIRQGASMKLRIPALEKEYDGTVTEISPIADPGSRTFRVKFDLPPAAALRAGLFGRVSVPVAPQKAIRVPIGAVVRRGQLEYVFVVQDARARLRLVRVGSMRDGQLEIVSGLDDGETIVAGGAAGVIDGQPVQTQPR